MFCPYCGVELPEDAAACRACGRASATAFGGAVTVPGTPVTPLDALTFRPGDSDAPTFASPAAEGYPAAQGRPAPQVAVGAARAVPPGFGTVGVSTGALGVGAAFGKRYHIIRLLGQGGMGAVYQAWDDALGVAVALKIIRPEITADPAAARDLERRFKRELLLARQVTHKHVVRIHDLGEIDGIKYLTMPYIQGSDLASILNREQKLPVGRAIAIARQVASGLQAAHEAGVVHRDLKPANVMIDADDQAVIMDFGIARSVSGGGATMAGAVVGTLEYMAPEQAMAQPVDHRADIYALGLMLYDMVLGPRQSSRAESAVAELMARVQKPLPPARSIDASLSEALERVIDRCTQPDPAARYQTTEQLVHDLELIDPVSKTAGTRPIAAPPITRPQEPMPAPQTARVVPLKALLAAAAVLAVAAAGGWLLWNRIAGESGGSPAGVKPVALAVLPFHNATGDSSLDSLGPTFAHLIRDGVGDSSGLRLVSPDRVSRLLRDLRLASNAEVDAGTIRRIGEFTSADHVVTGRFARLDAQFRFDATVYPAAGGEPIALTASAAAESDLLRAAQELAAKIRTQLAPAGDAPVAAFKPSSQSLPALRAYEEGLERARFGEHLEAVRRFEEATKADPDFALAFAQLGQTMANLRLTADAEAAAAKAIALSADLPREERELISAIHARITNDLPTAIAAYERLVQTRPMDVQLRFELAGLLDANGDLDRARDEYASVLDADPKFPEALFAAGRTAIRRADYKGSLEWFTRAQVLAVQLDNQEAQARVLHALGVAYKNLGRLDEALKQYEASLEIKRRIGDVGGIAQSLNELAQVHDLQGRSEEAMASYQQAIEAYREIGNKVGLGLALNNLGAYYLDRGQFDEALAALKEALPIQRELGDTDREALCLQNIGSTFTARGDYLDAITYLERALELRERSDVPSSIAEVLASLGEVAMLLGDYDRAQRSYLRAIELSRGAGDRRGEALGAMGMGVLHGLQGRLAASLGTHADALKIVRDLGDRSYVFVQALAGYGASLSAAGQFEEAARHLEEAASVARELRSGTLQAQTLNRLGDNAFYRGDAGGARTFYGQALQVAQRGSSRYDVLRSNLNLAKVASGASRVAALKKLVQEADALGLRYTSAESSLYLGQALLESGSQDAARLSLESALAKTGKLDARLLTARAHYLLGRLSDPSSEHFERARQIVDGVRGELKNEAVLARSDLKPIFEHQ